MKYQSSNTKKSILKSLKRKRLWITYFSVVFIPVVGITLAFSAIRMLNEDSDIAMYGGIIVALSAVFWTLYSINKVINTITDLQKQIDKQESKTKL